MNDDGLRALFAAARRRDAARAPGFADTLAVPRRRPSRARVPLALAAAAVAVVVAAVWLLRPAPEFPIDLAATRWEAPTDFLLRTPGAELLRSVPDVGSIADVTTMMENDRRIPR